jgi:hypothetical protein
MQSPALPAAMEQEQEACSALNLVVAGHASFPSHAAAAATQAAGDAAAAPSDDDRQQLPSFTSVWSSDDACFYDTIVLLQAPAADIASRSSSGSGSRAADDDDCCSSAGAAPATQQAAGAAGSRAWSRSQPLTAEQAAAWQAFEAATLREACSQPGAPRLVEAADAGAALAAIAHSLRFPAGGAAEAANRRRLLAAAAALEVQPGDQVLLLDGDGTLAAADSTKPYCEALGLPWAQVKGCFSDPARSGEYGGFGDFKRLALLLAMAGAGAEGEGGSTAGADVASLQSGLACSREAAAAQAAAEQVALDAPWVQLLCSRLSAAVPGGGRSRFKPVLLTAGRREVWRRVLQAHGLQALPLLATGHDYLVDGRGKAAVAQMLLERVGGGSGSGGGGSGNSAHKSGSGLEMVGAAEPAEQLLQGAVAGGVLCVADSLVDLPMLLVPGVEALVVPRRPSLLAVLEALQQEQAQQGKSFGQLVYDGLPAAAGSLPVVALEELAVGCHDADDWLRQQCMPSCLPLHAPGLWPSSIRPVVHWHTAGAVHAGGAARDRRALVAAPRHPDAPRRRQRPRAVRAAPPGGPAAGSAAAGAHPAAARRPLHRRAGPHPGRRV